MHTIVHHRRNSISTALGVLILALSVFGWGVQYKISLYDLPDSPSTVVPQAKLLSPKERPISVQASVAEPIPQPQSLLLPALLFATVLVGDYAIIVRGMRKVDIGRHDTRRHIGSVFFSFRPPPVVLPA